MFTENHQKVSADHLRRDAYLYVRQSSLRQVFQNTESTQRQYGLRERAVALGWPIERIHVIDNDQGRSGARSEGRDGFQGLVTAVAMGQAGIVLGLEVSRLARNNADWHRLIELAALSHTLILDEDGVYDPAHFNDRLLLGLKGTMSEAELHVLKARLQGGIRNKARRGELEMALPIGLAYGADGAVILDPDRQIQDTLRMVFETFEQAASACAVIRRFQREGFLFPRRIQSGVGKGDLQWGAVNHSQIVRILHNPRYAGAFVYGRTRGAFSAGLQQVQLKVPRENWQVLIREAHAGYISWEEYERNQITLRNNTGSFGEGRRGSVPREGTGLLQGRVVCGHCGARMRVRYQEVDHHLEPYYQCTEASVRHAGKPCQSVRGRAIDAAISDLLLETVAPAALEVALAVQEEIATRIEQADNLRRTQLERARYEAELARRRYLKVDPDNRLVADSLESDWNERLRRLDALQQEHERQRKADQGLLGDEARRRILALSSDFPRIWNDARTPPVQRKRMVALLIEDVTLLKAERVTIHVRFRGGQTQSLDVERLKPIALIRKTRPEVVHAIDALLETCTDAEVARRLNDLGHGNWKRQPFTAKKVITVRQAYGLKTQEQRLLERGLVPAGELARRFSISTSTVHKLGRAGVLRRHPCASPAQSLYEIPPDNVTLIPGKGGRHPRQAVLSDAQPASQETV